MLRGKTNSYYHLLLLGIYYYKYKKLIASNKWFSMYGDTFWNQRFYSHTNTAHLIFPRKFTCPPCSWISRQTSLTSSSKTPKVDGYVIIRQDSWELCFSTWTNNIPPDHSLLNVFTSYSELLKTNWLVKSVIKIKYSYISPLETQMNFLYRFKYNHRGQGIRVKKTILEMFWNTRLIDGWLFLPKPSVRLIGWWLS